MFNIAKILFLCFLYNLIYASDYLDPEKLEQASKVDFCSDEILQQNQKSFEMLHQKITDAKQSELKSLCETLPTSSELEQSFKSRTSYDKCSEKSQVKSIKETFNKLILLLKSKCKN